MSSGGVIQNGRPLADGVAEVAAQVIRCPHLDLTTTQECSQLQLHLGATQQARFAARLELQEHVDVTVAAEVCSQTRAEQRQSADVVPLAELCEQAVVDP